MGPKKKQRVESDDDDASPSTGVDPHFPGSGDSLLNDEGHVWAAELSMQEGGSDKFFVMQIVDDDGALTLFTRWGKTGSTGQSKCTPMASASDAKKEFRKKFREKSGNLWDGTFKYIAGKYKLDSRGGTVVDGGDTDEDPESGSDDDDGNDSNEGDESPSKKKAKKKKSPKKKKEVSKVPEALGQFAAPLITAVTAKPNWKQKIEKEKIVATWRKEYHSIVSGLLPTTSADRVFEAALALLKVLAERDDDNDDDYGDPDAPRNWPLDLEQDSGELGIPCHCKCNMCENGAYYDEDSFNDAKEEGDLPEEYKGKKDFKTFMTWEKNRCACAPGGVVQYGAIQGKRRLWLEKRTRTVVDLVPSALREKLLQHVAVLENVPEADRDWHPGSNNQVLDLVHPSLFCYVKGVTTVMTAAADLPEKPTKSGAKKKAKSSDGSDEEEEADEDRRRDANRINDDVLFSWIPTDFEVPKEPIGGLKAETTATAPSPAKAAPKKGAAAAAKPKWEWQDDDGDWLAFSAADMKVLQTQFQIDSVSPFTTKKMSFSTTNAVTFDFSTGWQKNEETGKLRQFRRVAPPSEATSSATGATATSPSYQLKRLGYINNVPTEAMADVITEILGYMVPHFQQVLDSRKKAKIFDGILPIYGDVNNPLQDEIELDDSAPWDDAAKLLSCAVQGFDKKLEEFTKELQTQAKKIRKQCSERLTAGLPWILPGRKIQVITKLANVELTPDRPSYDGGVWHLEGIAEEQIVATAIYYYSTDNVTDAELNFRVTGDNSAPQDGGDYIKAHMGFEVKDTDDYERRYGEAINVGSITTKEGTCLFFPNFMQHRLGPMQLIDKKKSGSRKILVFFLVDPMGGVDSRPAVSTSAIPDQRVNGVMTLTEAKAFRELLMHQRKYLTKDGNVFFERSFSLCEH